jgi:hypothetical protein
VAIPYNRAIIAQLTHEAIPDMAMLGAASTVAWNLAQLFGVHNRKLIRQARLLRQML